MFGFDLTAGKSMNALNPSSGSDLDSKNAVSTGNKYFGPAPPPKTQMLQVGVIVLAVGFLYLLTKGR